MSSKEKGTESARPALSSSERKWHTSEAIAILDDPYRTARGRAKRAIEQIEAMEVAPGREAEVAARVRDFVALLKDASSRSHLSDELIGRETEKLLTAIRYGGYGVASVVPVDEVTRNFAALKNEYEGGEIDIIRNLCSAGAKIEDGFDAEHIIIGGRMYTRYSLREAGRPASFTNVEKWHAQFKDAPVDPPERA